MSIKPFFRAATSLLLPGRNYSVSAIKKRFSRAFVLRSKSNINITPYPRDVLLSPYLFVLSTGRCGTELISNILAKSPALSVEHSPKPELEYVSSLIHRNNISGEALKVAVLAARFDLFFLQAFISGKSYVETNNRITFFAPALSELLPNSKFIHLVRNPADFVRSGMRRGYYQKDVVQHQRLDGSNYLPWNTFSRLEKIAWEWNEINSKIEDFKCIVSESRVLTINSESLFKDPSTVSSIYEFIGIKNPFEGRNGSQMLARLLSNPVNKQNQGSFPKYPDWSEADRIRFCHIVTLASKYGYFYQ